MSAEFPKERHMESISVQKAGQIDNPARQWLQGKLGRLLSEDEQLTIFVATTHAAPAAKDRRAALQQMEHVLDKAAENMKEIPDDEFNAAVDEAIDHLRKRSD